MCKASVAVRKIELELSHSREVIHKTLDIIKVRDEGKNFTKT